MPRFVLLYHDCPADVPRPSHCDLMLQSGDVLWTWVLAELPRDWAALATRRPGTGRLKIAATNAVVAERLADHRLAYLDYEGPVSGDRGSVLRLDGGTFDSIGERTNSWELTLAGNLLRGRISLRCTSDGGATWQLSVGD
jgi:hypothetical protein